MAGYTLATIDVSNNFGVNEWRDNLRVILRKVGTTGESGVLLIADTQLKEESFLEDINNILNTGEVGVWTATLP